MHSRISSPSGAGSPSYKQYCRKLFRPCQKRGSVPLHWRLVGPRQAPRQGLRNGLWRVLAHGGSDQIADIVPPRADTLGFGQPASRNSLESVPHAASTVPYRLGLVESVRVPTGAGAVPGRTGASPEVSPSTRIDRPNPLGLCSFNRRSPSCARFRAAFTSQSCSAPQASQRPCRSASVRPFRIA